jgi:hypothetical protein
VDCDASSVEGISFCPRKGFETGLSFPCAGEVGSENRSFDVSSSSHRGLGTLSVAQTLFFVKVDGLAKDYAFYSGGLNLLNR